MKRLITQRFVMKNKLLNENSQEIIIFFDNDGKILDCNAKASKELGYGEDIYHTYIWEIFKKVFKYENNKLNIDLKYIRTLGEATAYRKNLTCFPVDLKVAFIREKKIKIGLCTAINISVRKEAIHEVNQLKNELNSFDQSRNEFIANITHELRTPVSGIVGLSNNLMDTELLPDQLEAVNIIKRCCTNMNSIINDLLDYAKIANEKLMLEQREFDFNNFLNQIINFNRISVNEKGLKLIVNISKDIPTRVIGDEYRLSQILNNLLSNAIKFTAVGQIGLEVTNILQTDHYVELFFVIIDTGIGIDIAEKDKIFQSFFQVDGSIKRKFGGTGLGLSICRKLVESMNGTIAVDSEIDKGSTFSFSVRLGIPQETKEEEIGTEQEKDTSDSDINREANAKNIVDFEDSEINRIGRMLQDVHYSPLANMNRVDIMKESVTQMLMIIEKLTICIEMKNWEKAEEIATLMKQVVPLDHNKIAKDVLRLLLAVRSENYDVSLNILSELREIADEEQ